MGVGGFVTTVPLLSDEASVGAGLVLGMQFTVGPSNIEIVSLGRWVQPGNNQTHLLKLVYPYPDKRNVPNGFTTINCSGAPTNAFIYGDLLYPIVLPAGATYYLVSVELGVDQVYSGTSFGVTSAAILDSSVYGLLDGSGYFNTGVPNSMYGPVDFKYRLTSSPATQFRVGSLYPLQTSAFPNSWARVTSVSSPSGTDILNLVGTVDLRLYWRGGAPDTTWSGVLQYYYDDEIPIGSPVADFGTISSPALFITTWDTTTVPDGTHVVYARFIDAVGYSAYNAPIIGNAAVIHNGGFVNGAQDVWVVPGPQNEHRFGGMPDKVHYAGVPCPVNNSYLPYPGPATVPPATADPRYMGANAALLRDSSHFIVEMSRAACGEWEGFYRWMSMSTNGSGGGIGTGGGVFAWVEDAHRSGVGVDEATSRNAFVALGYDGPRFDNFIAAGFSTFVETPSGDGWYGIELSGRVFKLTHEGEVTTLAGPKQDRTSTNPPWCDTDTHVTLGPDEALEDVITNAGVIVGTFDASVPGPEYMLGSADLCIDPRDTDVLYIASEYLNCIFKVNLNFSPAHISLYAGTYDEPGFLNVTGTGATNALFQGPTSIQMAPDGTMYVADCAVDGVTDGNQLIRYVTPDGLSVGTLCGQVGSPTAAQAANSNLVQTYSPTNFTPIPFSSPNCYIVNARTIRFNSTGTQLILLENQTSHVRKIDLVAQTVTYIGRGWDSSLPPNYAGSTQWQWLDVDRRGTCGPVDDIILNNPTTAPACWRMSSDGSYAGEFSADASTRYPVLIGRGDNVGSGHYGWSISIAGTQGRMITSGTTSTAGHQFRIGQATGGDANLLANPSPFDQNISDRGIYTVTFGSSGEWPINCRPSFYSLFSRTGMNQNGTPTFDDLNATYPTDDVFATFLQSGAGGIAPRPELTGKQLRDLIYYIRRYSFAGSYPNPVSPGPDDPLDGLAYPVVLSCTATRLSPTSIQVNWTTDRPTIGMAVACTDVQFTYGATDGAYNKFSPIEPLTASTYTTSHSAVITGLSPNHPIHYSAQVKDIHGGFGYAADNVLAPAVSSDGSFITNGTGTLLTAHGLWSFGSLYAPTPAWGIGPFYQVLLNGQAAGPSQIFGGWQKLIVNFGGNMYGLTFDHVWYQWVGGQWQPNFGADAASGPASMPTPPALPTTFSGPYIPSPDGTAISGGTGSLTTLDGVWTFGSANGGGWNLVLNGQTMWLSNSGTPGVPIAVTHLQVSSHGHLFYQTVDSAWHVWAGTQPNNSALGAVGSPIPVGMVFSPSLATIHSGAAAGTVITTVSVIMNDGTSFAGSLSVGLDMSGTQTAVASGLRVVKNMSSIPVMPSIFPVTATQNGSSFTAAFDMQVVL